LETIDFNIVNELIDRYINNYLKTNNSFDKYLFDNFDKTDLNEIKDIFINKFTNGNLFMNSNKHYSKDNNILVIEYICNYYIEFIYDTMFNNSYNFDSINKNKLEAIMNIFNYILNNVHIDNKICKYVVYIIKHTIEYDHSTINQSHIYTDIKYIIDNHLLDSNIKRYIEDNYPEYYPSILIN